MVLHKQVGAVRVPRNVVVANCVYYYSQVPGGMCQESYVCLHIFPGTICCTLFTLLRSPEGRSSWS